mgnify:CR=1 FL=1
MIGAWLRRSAFWVLDAARGGEIRRFYKEIAYINTSGEVNIRQLENLLAHASSTTKFYRIYAGKPLSEYPILTKNDLREYWDDICSSNYRGKKLYTTHTSGSTGIPLTMRWNSEKRHRQLADIIYFNEIANQKLGQPYAFYREEGQRYQKSQIERWKQNLTVIDVTHLDQNKLESICQRLEQRPYFNMCMGYASTHEAVLNHMLERKGKHEYHLTSLITSSEVLPIEKKLGLKSIIGCQVIDRYSNEENGIIAQTGDVSDDFNVNYASFHVEILKIDSDEPASYGEVGRIVITDLYNYAVPLIRYETGDLSICASKKNGWVTRLKTIQGRQSDIIYDTLGRKITTSNWTVYMCEFDKIRQYQLIQIAAKKYCLKVNVAKGIYRDADIVYAVKRILGKDAYVEVDYVTGVPALSSGKFKKTVCIYKYNPDDYSTKD